MNQIHPEPLSGTLVDILEETAEEFQSYPELLRNAKEMAQVLYRRGLRPRTPLILSVDASRTFLEIFWGCLFSGVLPAPLAHMRTPKADSMEAQKIFHVWEAIKAPIVADSSNERAFAVLTDMFKGTGATLIAKTSSRRPASSIFRRTTATSRSMTIPPCSSSPPAARVCPRARASRTATSLRTSAPCGPSKAAHPRTGW